MEENGFEKCYGWNYSFWSWSGELIEWNHNQLCNNHKLIPAAPAVAVLLMFKDSSPLIEGGGEARIKGDPGKIYETNLWQTHLMKPDLNDFKQDEKYQKSL